MANEPTDMHGPAASARPQSNKVARCTVCGCQWQILSLDESPADAQGCAFCDAPEKAITIISEAPGYEGYPIN